MIKLMMIVFVSTVMTACSVEERTETVEVMMQTSNENLGDTIKKIEKTESEWKNILTAEEFEVLRKAGTERAFSGDLLENKEVGTYVCAGCNLPLFASETKFKSGTGWPSFYMPINTMFVGEKTDNKYGWDRTEVVCNRCDGHLGHVFNDGPKPTGLRYCINSVSLNFEKKSNE